MNTVYFGTKLGRKFGTFHVVRPTKLPVATSAGLSGPPVNGAAKDVLIKTTNHTLTSTKSIFQLPESSLELVMLYYSMLCRRPALKQS
jgi:hypothetical protein